MGVCDDQNNVCEGICGPTGGTYIPNISLCECFGLVTIGNVCDEECQEQQKRLSIEGGILLVKDYADTIHATFDLAGLSGRSDVLFGSPTCPADSCPAILCAVTQGAFAPVHMPFCASRFQRPCRGACTPSPLVQLLCEADGSMRGYFGVPNELIEAMDERLKASTPGSRQNRLRTNRLTPPSQRRARFLQSTDQVPFIESPLLCILTGSTVLWQLEAGTEPVYPVYVDHSLLNTISNFDAGKFRYALPLPSATMGN